MSIAVKAPRSNSTRMIGLGGEKQRDGGGQRQQQGEFERAVLARQHRRVVAGAELVAEVGQQHHADGDADHAERQLEQAVGVIEPGHDAVLQAWR